MRAAHQSNRCSFAESLPPTPPVTMDFPVQKMPLDLSKQALTPTSTRDDQGDGEDTPSLAPTKIRRTYTCVKDACMFRTSNPREFLYHRRDVHNEKVVINECPHCVYACQYTQKLRRHIQLIHKIQVTPKRGRMPKRPGAGTPDSAKLVKSVKSTKSVASAASSPEYGQNLFLDMQQYQSYLQSLHEGTFHAIAEARLRYRKAFKSNFEPTANGRHVDNDFATEGDSADSKQFDCDVQDEEEWQNLDELPKAPTPPIAYQPPTPTKKFRCHSCGYSTDNQSQFKKHCNYHNAPKIKCEFCHFSSVSGGKLLSSCCN